MAEGESAANDTEIQESWLYAILTWVYEHRDKLPDPLGIVEELYADFDYPPEISSFVRYMPPSDNYEPKLIPTNKI